MPSPSTLPIDLDRLDLKILDALQKDGRISNLILAESVALSPTAVLALVQRLTRDGFIVGYEARLDPLKLGAAMMVFVEVLLDRTTPNGFAPYVDSGKLRLLATFGEQRSQRWTQVPTLKELGYGAVRSAARGGAGQIRAGAQLPRFKRICQRPA